MMNIRKLGELYVSFFKIGGLTFGGGLAMLPMLQREIVTDRRWCTEEEILDMYAIGQCTPGHTRNRVFSYAEHCIYNGEKGNRG